MVAILSGTQKDTSLPGGPASTFTVMNNGASFDAATSILDFIAGMSLAETVAGHVKATVAPAGTLGRSVLTLTSGDVSTASATFVDTTGVTLTVTMGVSGIAMVGIIGGANIAGVGHNISFDIAVDGTRQGGGTNGLLGVTGPAANYDVPINFLWVPPTALSLASHTFKIQWRVGGGDTALIHATAASPLTFFVQELRN